MNAVDRPSGFVGVRYEHLCPRGARLHVLVDHHRGALARTAQLLQNAEDHYPGNIPRYRDEITTARAQLDSQRARLAAHVAHCTDGCQRAKNGPAFAGEAQTGMWSRSPAHTKTPLPSASALAAMIASGQTTQGLGLVYDRHPSTISQTVTRAGYSSRTGKPIRPRHEPSPRTESPLLIQYPPWMDEALCAQTDPEAFFPEKGGSTREAKKVCGRCPVRAECLDHALANAERFGIFGGYSERQRRKLTRGCDQEIA